LRDVKYFTFVDRFIDLLNGRYAPTLSSAISSSARFPVVTPPALHQDADLGLQAQLVDGGYFESSGAYTAINLLDLLRRSAANGSPSVVTSGPPSQGSCGVNNVVTITTPTSKNITACVKFITIRGRTAVPRDFSGGDLLSPLATMYEVATAKGISDLALLYNLFCGGTGCGTGCPAIAPNIYVKYLDPIALNLPLGWYLSNHAASQILEERQPSVDCNLPGARNPPLHGITTHVIAEENALLYPRIIGDILGE
jgi:hypothetical protein